jgi:transcriptional regulator with XRE-family HTH domain
MAAGAQRKLTSVVRMAHITAMQLANWMAEHGVRDEDLAEALGVDRSTISRIRRRKQRPSLELAAGIERITKGKVGPFSFLPADKERAA